MSHLWPHLPEAAADFRFLLSRGYPRAAALTLVGNRYNLDHTTRQLLHRGVFAPEIAAARRAKLRLLRELPGLPLALDGHNVLITLECARRGVPLVAADDGWLRDVGQVSRSFRPSAATEVLALLAAYLARHTSGTLAVYYDAPLSFSGELAKLTGELWSTKGLKVTAQAVPVPERELAGFPGAIATSDTALIDAHDPVVDLAGEIIRQHGQGQIIGVDAPESAAP